MRQKKIIDNRGTKRIEGPLGAPPDLTALQDPVDLFGSSKEEVECPLNDLTAL